MKRVRSIDAVILAVVLAYGTGFAASATLQNAGFDTYLAATDSFPFWKADRDTVGNGTLFDISQETTGAYSAPGSLKMEIKAGADTLTECRISGSVTNLPAKKIFTVTAMVKYSGMPTYWNAMLNMQQATLTQGTWVWTDRKWSSMWGNNPGDAEWTPVSVSDTTHDSTNVVNFIISLSKAGTLWVDDITITYADVPVVRKAIQTSRRNAFQNNRIVFPSDRHYSLEVFGVNGKKVLCQSATAARIDLSTLGLRSGSYIVKVKSAGKRWEGRVVVGK
ncbi:MAG: T9SS type A sorting domain-containing protein [Chitinispirillaceae bacterium]|nr:T9SS type A sorting domain-containing protein [Chitinispirillaceae bacterium]